MSKSRKSGTAFRDSEVPVILRIYYCGSIKESKAKEYKHMTFYEAAELAKNADVKEMWLTHYSPSLIRPADYVGNIKNIFKNVRAAKDGQSVTLNFEDEE